MITAHHHSPQLLGPVRRMSPPPPSNSCWSWWRGVGLGGQPNGHTHDLLVHITGLPRHQANVADCAATRKVTMVSRCVCGGGGGYVSCQQFRAHPAGIVLLVHLETPYEQPRLRGALCCQPVLNGSTVVPLSRVSCLLAITIKHLFMHNRCQYVLIIHV
jgi:hypothetical protein